MEEESSGLVFGKLVVILIVAALLVGASAMAYFYMAADDGDDDDDNNSGNGGDEYRIFLTGRDGTEKNMTLSEVMELTQLVGHSSYKNQFDNVGGDGIYKGVKLSDLVEMVGGMEPGDTLRIDAKDPDTYYQEFSYLNVYPDEYWYEMQGDLILACENYNSSYPDWDDGPMNVFLPEDGLYDLEDAKWTSVPGQGWHLNPSGGARWVKNTESITVIPGSEEWSIDLEGRTTKTLYQSEFDNFKTLYNYTFTDYKDREYSGALLSQIIGIVDGAPCYGDEAFNTTAADAGYVILPSAVDYSSRITSNMLDTVILADEEDGELIGEGDGPIKLTGPDLKGFHSVKNVSSIVMDETPIPGWELLLNGSQGSASYSFNDLLSMRSTTGLGSRVKTGYDYSVSGPYEYEGIELMEFLEEVGLVDLDYSVEIIPNDPYLTTLTKNQTLGMVEIFDNSGNSLGLGEMTPVIAFMEGGEYLSEDYGGPLRLVWLDDHGTPTDGMIWTKYVTKVQFNNETIEEWDIDMSSNITGFQNEQYTMVRSEFESTAQCGQNPDHKVNYTDKYGNLWEGVPLWILVSTVDGNDTAYHHGFNDSLAQDGYTVKVWSEDGFNATYSSQQVSRNNSIIAAYLKNGERLEPGDWPVRIVGGNGNGDDLSGKLRPGNVVKMELINP